MKDIIRNEGFRSLYSGLLPSLVGVFPYAAIDLGVNSKLRDFVNFFFPILLDFFSLVPDSLNSKQSQEFL